MSSRWVPRNYISSLAATNLKSPWRQFSALNTIVKFTEKSIQKVVNCLWNQKKQHKKKSQEIMILNFFVHKKYFNEIMPKKTRYKLCMKKWRFNVSNFCLARIISEVRCQKYSLFHQKKIRINLLISQFILHFPSNFTVCSSLYFDGQLWIQKKTGINFCRVHYAEIFYIPRIIPAIIFHYVWSILVALPRNKLIEKLCFRENKRKNFINWWIRFRFPW